MNVNLVDEKVLLFLLFKGKYDIGSQVVGIELILKDYIFFK